jgi:hypothetical protein
MWCTVHVLYQKGKRIPAEVAKANGVYGWLHMRSKTPVVGMPKPEAFLLRGPDGDPGRPMLHLENCSLRAIVGGGIRLVGFDMHLASQPAVWQSWWIIPGERQ